MCSDERDFYVLPVQPDSRFKLEGEGARILGAHGLVQCLHRHNPHFIPRLTCKGPLLLVLAPEPNFDHLLWPYLTCETCGLNTKKWDYHHILKDKLPDFCLSLARWAFMQRRYPQSDSMPAATHVSDAGKKHYSCYSTLNNQVNTNNSLHLALLPSKASDVLALEGAAMIIHSLISESRESERAVKHITGYR